MKSFLRLLAIAAGLATLPCLAGEVAAPAAAPGGPTPTAPAPPPLPEPLRIKLRNVLWQTLPQEIQRVWVGPDDRVWYQRRCTGPQPTTADVRRVIEREFDQESPVLWGAVPALFEPKGRVWFLFESQENNHNLIGGYDGKTWIDRAGPGAGFAGSCPGPLYSWEHRSNVFVDGRVFFPDNDGVHVYDGKDWTYQNWFPDTRSNQAPDLVPLADGKTVVGYPRWGLGPVRQWRDGKWTEMKLPAALGNNNLFRIVPADETGLWVIPVSKLMIYWPLTDALPADVAALATKLADPAFKVREEATQAFIRGGPRLKGYAEKLLSQTQDPEVAMRLKRVLETLAKDGKETLRLAGYRLTQPLLYGRDTVGRMYLVGRVTPDDGKTPEFAGTLVLFPDGTVRAAPHAKATGRIDELGCPVLLVPPGRQVWLPGRPARLVDMQKDAVILEAPEGQFGWLHSLRSDGTVFMTQGDPKDSGMIVGVCRPGAPDDRSLIAAKSYELNNRPDHSGGPMSVALSPDGTLWAYLLKEGLCRFDDGVWREVTLKGLAAQNPVEWMVAGLGGTLLVRCDKGAAWVTPEGVDGGDWAETVAGHHRDEVIKAFPAATAPVYRGLEGFYSGIVADKAGNLWLIDRARLRVMIARNTWISPGQEVTNPTMPFMAAVGNGSKVYVSNNHPDTQAPNALLAEVRDGRLVMVPAPSSDCPAIKLGIRDAEGALWVPHSGGSTAHAIQSVTRVTDKGAVEEIEGRGGACLLDQGGNLWLAALSPAMAGRILIRHPGAADGELFLPLSWRSWWNTSPMTSDRPGSVYVWTQAGLTHLVAADPAKPTQFKVSKTWSVTGVRGRVKDLRFVAPGYLVATTSYYVPSVNNSQEFINIIPLPKE
jgi:hypothetical protein